MDVFDREPSIQEMSRYLLQESQRSYDILRAREPDLISAANEIVELCRREPTRVSEDGRNSRIVYEVPYALSQLPPDLFGNRTPLIPSDEHGVRELIDDYKKQVVAQGRPRPRFTNVTLPYGVWIGDRPDFIEAIGDTLNRMRRQGSSINPTEWARYRDLEPSAAPPLLAFHAGRLSKSWQFAEADGFVSQMPSQAENLQVGLAHPSAIFPHTPIGSTIRLPVTELGSSATRRLLISTLLMVRYLANNKELENSARRAAESHPEVYLWGTNRGKFQPDGDPVMATLVGDRDIPQSIADAALFLLPLPLTEESDPNQSILRVLENGLIRRLTVRTTDGIVGPATAYGRHHPHTLVDGQHRHSFDPALTKFLKDTRDQRIRERWRELQQIKRNREEFETELGQPFEATSTDNRHNELESEFFEKGKPLRMFRFGASPCPYASTNAITAMSNALASIFRVVATFPKNSMNQ